jgi:hypothetical protein
MRRCPSKKLWITTRFLLPRIRKRNMALRAEYLFESLPDPYQRVDAEIRLLQSQGYDVAWSDTKDYVEADPDRQAFTDAAIDGMTAETRIALERGDENPQIMYDSAVRPAFAQEVGGWGHLRMRAIALQTLYAEKPLTLGDDIDPAVFRSKIPINGTLQSPAEILIEAMAKTGKEDEAEKIVAHHEAFVGTPIDENSRLIFELSKDAQAIRTRAVLASKIISEHFANTGKDTITSASLACGAATPIYGIVRGLEQLGIKTDKITLADIDPLALAAAYSLAESAGLQDRVDLQHTNLITGDLTELIGDNGVDVIDLLGLFEYLRPHTAAKLLKRAAATVKDEGIIVFGNMLKDRPQQQFFTDVVQWPSLQQRTIAEVIELVKKAGFDPKNDLSIRIPSGECVYAIYALKMPESDTQISSRAGNVAALAIRHSE